MTRAPDFESLVREQHPRVLRLCASLLGSWTEAEDAAQEVFLKAARALPEWRGESSVATWLYRIASNHCMDVLRRAARRPAVPFDELFERAEPDDAPAREAKDLAAKALARLSPEYRLVLVLRELEGLSYEEISAATGASLDSVKARLRRARRELAEAARHFSAPGDV